MKQIITVAIISLALSQGAWALDLMKCELKINNQKTIVTIDDTLGGKAVTEGSEFPFNIESPVFSSLSAKGDKLFNSLTWRHGFSPVIAYIGEGDKGLVYDLSNVGENGPLPILLGTMTCKPISN